MFDDPYVFFLVMKTLSVFQAWSLALLFASTVRALAIDTKNASISRFEERETACIALGTCPGNGPPPSQIQASGQPPAKSPAPTLSKSRALASLHPPKTTLGSPVTTTLSTSRRPPDPTLSIQRAAMTPYLYGCNKEQKEMVQKAWSGAGEPAEAHAKWKPPGSLSSGSYQAAMAMYLGSKSKNDDPWVGTGPLKKNILRQQGIHKTSQEWSPYWSYAYIYCDEDKVPEKPGKPKQPQCNRPNNPKKKVMAYTFPDDGSWYSWNAKYVVLCLRFFDKDILSLEDQVAAARKDIALQKFIDPWRKTGARSLFHETCHWSPEVSDPPCNRKKEIYDPALVVKLASAENVAGSRTNAESWTQAAMAIYVQQTFNLKDPPVPREPATANILSPMETGISDDDIEELFFDQPPDWFLPPVPLTAPSFKPDMMNVQQV